ncbi:MAG: major facilitator superfamily MFS_1 [uncultured bacterium]|nr:MAG: major facilitator superfamily MFS_1 [uncultured bacterium]
MRINLEQTFVALQSPNYRRYFVANSISSLGTWMQRLGMSWLVYKLTGSASWLGIVTFFGWFSSFLLMPWAGALLDSGPRRKILVASQILGFTQAMVLAVMTYTGVITVNWLLLLSIMLGLVNAFDMPGRHSFVSDMVEDKKMMANAIALNSISFNLARLIGPALAGIVVAKLGEAPCFLMNSLSFVPMAWVLFRMHIASEAGEHKPDESFRTRIIEGFRYSATHPVILPAFLLISVMSLMGMPVQMVLMPIIADQHLGGDAATLGYLTSAMGFGAVIGALSLALRKKVEGVEKIVPVAFGLYGLFTVILAFSRNQAVSFLLCGLMGTCIVSGWSASNTLLQTVAEKRMMSRVMSIYMMCFSGMSPIGSLVMGWFSTYTTTSAAMIVGGTSCFASSVIYMIYRRCAPLSGEKVFTVDAADSR